MQTPITIEAMAERARVDELTAKAYAKRTGDDTTFAQGFAAGVEAGLLWVLGNIKEIPFSEVEHVKPSSNDPDEGVDAMLDKPPGLTEPEAPPAAAVDLMAALRASIENACAKRTAGDEHLRDNT
jgi:hypothetical protein